jgi:hypothetical protein
LENLEKALYLAHKTGLQVNIGLTNGVTLENVIIEKLRDHSFHIKKESIESEEDKDISKAIVAIKSVNHVEFHTLNKETSSKDPIKEIRKALKKSKEKSNSISVHFSKDGVGEKIEGIIIEVGPTDFHIKKQLDTDELADTESINISDVQFIEYS